MNDPLSEIKMGANVGIKRQTIFELLEKQFNLIDNIQNRLGVNEPNQNTEKAPAVNKLETIFDIVNVHNRKLSDVLSALDSI